MLHDALSKETLAANRAIINWCNSTMASYDNDNGDAGKKEIPSRIITDLEEESDLTLTNLNKENLEMSNDEFNMGDSNSGVSTSAPDRDQDEYTVLVMKAVAIKANYVACMEIGGESAKCAALHREHTVVTDRMEWMGTLTRTFPLVPDLEWFLETEGPHTL